jgi:hypothetical protein
MAVDPGGLSVQVWLTRPEEEGPSSPAGESSNPYRCRALKLEPLLAAKAKEKQEILTGGAKPHLLQNSAKAEPIETRAELAKVSGLSHDTIH